MNENQDQKINKLIELVSQNQETLKKMHRNLRFQTIIKTAYWVVVILSLIGAYIFLKPTYKVIKTNLNEIQSLQSSPNSETETIVKDYDSFKPFLSPNGTFIQAIKNFFNLN